MHYRQSLYDNTKFNAQSNSFGIKVKKQLTSCYYKFLPLEFREKDFN